MIEYYFNVNSVRTSLVNNRIFIINGWFRKNNPEENKVSIYLDELELPYKIEKRTGIEVKRKYIALDQQVDREYDLEIELPEGYDKYEDLYIYTENEEEKRLSLSIPKAQIKDMMDNCIYCVDDFFEDKKNHEHVIKGWVASLEDVRFKVTSLEGVEQDIEVKRNSRLDVEKEFRESKELTNAGFEIRIKNSKMHKFIFIMSTENLETVEMVSMTHKVREKRFLRFILKGLYYFKKHGLLETLKKIKQKIRQRKNCKRGEVDYNTWRLRHIPTKEELRRQAKKEYPLKPVFSIVVPLYKTPVQYLEELIRSVQNQTYGNWELCLSDGSGEDSPIQMILKEWKEKEPRIKVVYKGKPLQISENTNEAMKIATGDFIVFVDHDDLLPPNALYECAKAYNQSPQTEFLYSDEDKVSMDGKDFFQPHFKPDFNIDLLCSMNYISHLSVVKKELADRIGYLNPEYDGAQDYDFVLRCVGATKNIYHIPKVLYHWRAHKDSTAENPESKMYAFEAGAKAIQAYYDRMGISATVSQGEYPGLYRTKYIFKEEPLISILIPNKDHIEDLDKCIQSIEKKSSYRNYEYIVIENNSTEEETFEYYKKLEKTNSKVHVVRYKGDFNYSSINNYGATFAKGDYLLLLNNDTEIINEDCLSELLGYCTRDDVGIVGARLYYEDDTVQHAGVVIGFGGIAGHTFIGYDRTENGYFSRIICAADYSAVTAACMMVKRSVFDEVGGLSTELKVAFNDIDFCLKVRATGKLVVYNPYAELHHYESKSRGLEDSPEKIKRFNNEIDIFLSRWPEILEKGDPYYNPNLSLNHSNFSLRED